MNISLAKGLISFLHIGDAIGKPEVFELDSLIMYASNSKSYNEKYGGEFLQLVYTIEKLFDEFQSRQRIIQVIYRKTPSHNCTQATVLLFRELLIQHLKQNTEIPVLDFETWKEGLEDGLFEQTPTSFFFSNLFIEESSNSSFISKLFEDFSILLLEGISFEGYEIFAFTLTEDTITTNFVAFDDRNDLNLCFDGKEFNSFLVMFEELSVSPSIEVIAFSCHKLMKSTFKNEKLEFFCQVLLLQQFISEEVSLVDRCFCCELEDEQQEKEIYRFLQNVSQNLLGITKWKNEIKIDLIDGLLFTTLLVSLEKQNFTDFLPKNKQQSFKDVLIMIGLNPSQSQEVFSFKFKKNTSLNKIQNLKIKLIEVRNNLISGCIPELEKNLKSKNLEKKVELVSKIYKDEHHWHNGKLYAEDFVKIKFRKKMYLSEQYGRLESYSSEMKKNSTFNFGVKVKYSSTNGWQPKLKDKTPHIIVSFWRSQRILDLNVIGKFHEDLKIKQLIGISETNSETQIYNMKHSDDLIINKDNKNFLCSLKDIDEQFNKLKIVFEQKKAKKEFTVNGVFISGKRSFDHVINEQLQKQSLSTYFNFFSNSLLKTKVVKRDITLSMKSKKTEIASKKLTSKQRTLLEVQQNRNKKIEETLEEYEDEIRKVIEFYPNESLERIESKMNSTLNESQSFICLKYLIEEQLTSCTLQKDRVKLFYDIIDLLRYSNQTKKDFTSDIIKIVDSAFKKLKYFDIFIEHIDSFNLSSTLKKGFVKKKIPETKSKVPFHRFQLKYGGGLMKRETDSQFDPRISEFAPDKWQREVLDAVENKKSVVVVAPTSSGKTFISYFAIQEVMNSNKNIEVSSQKKLIVMVAPTKALVSQISADIYSKYGMVFGTFTRESRENMEHCTILITVPQCLDILFFSPNRRDWIKRIAYIVYDEVHQIGSVDGEIWERLLQLNPCPFIALSATISGPQPFIDWLTKTQKSEAKDSVVYVSHKYRYSDIKTSIYLPRESQNDEKDLVNVHPFAPFAFVRHLNSQYNSILKEIQLSPSETLELYDVMTKIDFGDHIKEKLVLEPYDPAIYFSKVFCVDRRESRIYSEELTTILAGWMKDIPNLAQNVFKKLSKNIRKAVTETPKKENILQFLTDLRDDDLLPCLVFSFSQAQCVNLAIFLDNFLEIKKNEAMKKHHISLERIMARNEKIEQLIKRKNDEIELKKRTLEEIELDYDFTNPMETKYYEILNKYSFCDLNNTNKISEKEKDYWVDRIIGKTGWDLNHPLMRALRRGFGVHHAGLPKPYRDYVEVLFRKKCITTVFATGTLAFGINMPCKTTVFMQESNYLTPLMYHQMRGRSGRRGYDNIGHCIFYDFNPYSALNLMITPLPNLHGHYTLNASTVLRSLDLFQEIEEDKEKNLISRLKNLLLPSFGFGQPDNFEEQIQFHYRFILEFLSRNEIINEKGSPVGLSEIVSHLNYEEPVNFLLVKLLESKEIRKLCSGFSKNKESVGLELMKILTHIYGRIKIFKNDKNKEEKKMESLDEEYQEIITKYNQEVMKSFFEINSIFAENFLDIANSMILPISKLSYFKSNSFDLKAKIHTKLHNNILLRSPFQAMSGFKNVFDSPQDVFDNRRHDMFFEKNLIPLIDFGDDISGYAFSFYKSGNASILKEKYGLVGKKTYDSLKEWVLFLKTIVRTLENMSKKPDKIDIKKSSNSSKEVKTQTHVHDSVLATFKFVLSKFEDNFINSSENNFDDFFQVSQKSLDSIHEKKRKQIVERSVIE
eukprot:gene8183-11_t